MCGETVSGRSKGEQEEPHPSHDLNLHWRHSPRHCTTPRIGPFLCSTFCGQLRTLGKVFFQPMFKHGSYHPVFLTMTATMMQSLLPLLNKLSTVDWTQITHQMWAPALMFQQQNIDIRMNNPPLLPIVNYLPLGAACHG